jgi:CPA1 family monovalent cation:H+ antiporter
MLIALFAMVLATDAVSVAAIFSPFKLPHSLKVLTEGESLFNDATAVIAFFFIALPLIQGQTVSSFDVTYILFKVLIVSTLIGLLVGFIAQFIMRFFHEALDEFIMILLTAYVAFAIAESHAIHVSGILALIVAVMTLKVFINRSLSRLDQSHIELNEEEQHIIKQKEVKLITTKVRLDQNKELITFFAFFANAVLFFSLAQLVHFEQMLVYWKEIIGLFVATTLIRAVMMLKFSFISKTRKHIIDVNYRWWGVLTFAGIKGGLSMIMVHALPETFVHKAMFEQIVMGIIILSIFVYALALIFIISKYKTAFEYDIKLEHHE